jgi:hypothetical protein
MEPLERELATRRGHALKGKIPPKPGLNQSGTNSAGPVWPEKILVPKQVVSPEGVQTRARLQVEKCRN